VKMKISCIPLVLISVRSSLASLFCGDCMQVNISATGPASISQPDSFGIFNLNGSFWENMIPFFKSTSNVKYLTIHPMANIEFDYVPWIVSDHFSSVDLTKATLRTQDREGILCPWEPKGLIWEFKTPVFGTWAVDSTIKVVCSSHK